MTDAALLPPDHPLRKALVEEMRARRFAPVITPARIVQLVVLVDSADRAREREHVEAAIIALGGATSANNRSALVRGPKLTFVWERHSEASTYTLIVPDEVTPGFVPPDLSPLPAGWLAAIPGQAVRATLIVAVDSEDPNAPQWPRESREEIVSCSVGPGARIWSDFKLYPDGFGRLLIHSKGLDRHDLGRLVQRLQELGNYRNMALLGLHVAQEGAARLQTLEARLAERAHDVAESNMSDEALLTDLSALSAELATIAAATGFRMGATRAYAQVAGDRLASLHIGRIPGYQTLADYTERRLTPAVRTCASFVDRLKDLNARTADIIALLRARIETRIEAQNLESLASMNANARRQLELQTLVERFSVVAVTYYTIGLIAYVAKAAEHRWSTLDASFIAAAALPVVAGIVLWRMATLRGKDEH